MYTKEEKEVMKVLVQKSGILEVKTSTHKMCLRKRQIMNANTSQRSKREEEI